MQRFKNILLLTNGESESKVAFDQAVALCQKNQARLTVIDVVEDVFEDIPADLVVEGLAEMQQQIVKARRSRLKYLVAPLRQEGLAVEINVLTGAPFLTIIREVLRSGHDLVIMTADSHGGSTNRLFGSTAMHLMRKCPCPVWVVKSNQAKHYRRILAAVNPAAFDEEKHRLDVKIMALASSLAQWEQCELHIIHTWLLPGESTLQGDRSQIPGHQVDKFTEMIEYMHRDKLNNLLHRFPLAAVDYKIHLLKGPPGDLIPAIAREYNIDLIVMGTVSRTGVAGFFIGNTAENVLGQVNCAVLTVKPDGFVTPVELEA